MQKLRRAGRAGALQTLKKSSNGNKKSLRSKCIFFQKNAAGQHFCGTFLLRYMRFIFDEIWQWYENLQISFYMKFSSLPGIPKDPTMWCQFQVMRGVQVPDRRGRMCGRYDLQLGMMSFALQFPCNRWASLGLGLGYFQGRNIFEVC